MAVGMALGMAIGMALGMTLAQRYDWSGTPLKAGLSPAAAHCKGFTACAADPGVSVLFVYDFSALFGLQEMS